jgi:hypothetical protein
MLAMLDTGLPMRAVPPKRESHRSSRSPSDPLCASLWNLGTSGKVPDLIALADRSPSATRRYTALAFGAGNDKETFQGAVGKRYCI